MIRAIRYSEEFTLLLALCNSNEIRRKIIHLLRELAPEKKIEDVPLNESIDNLYHLLSRRFHGDSGEDSLPEVLMVYGLETWLPSGEEAERSPFVRNLNAARNHFPRLFPGVLLLWISDHHLEAIARGAPDFFSVRSGIYFFASTEGEIHKTESVLQMLGLDGVAGMSMNDKLRRAGELEKMLEQETSLPESERDLKRERRLIRAAAETFYTLAKYDKAEPLLRRVLQIDEEQYGPNHPEVATDLNNLASLLQATNRLKEAETLYRRALEIDEASYGPDHPDVAIRLNNLAQLLQATNRLKEAKPMMRRVVEIVEKSYEKNHPKVAVAINNLAGLFQATNRLSEAEPLFRRSLEINKKSYGPDHPNVATDLNNLAELLKATNRLSEAEPLMRRSFEIDEKSYGPNHPNVAKDLNNLASLLQLTNRLKDAEPLMRRALEIDEASYGPDHPDVARDLGNLAMIEWEKKNPGEARRLLERALTIFRSSFNEDHPYVQETLRRMEKVSG